MSENTDPAEQPNPFEEMLASLLGPEAGAEAARQMAAQGMDFSALAKQMPAGKMPGMGQLKHLFQSSTGPVNWSVAKDIAVQLAYQSGDPSLSAAQAERVRQALTIGDLWLDPVTDLVSPGVTRAAWSKVGWVEGTLESWKQICEPVAVNVTRALTELMEEGLARGGEDQPAELRQMGQSLAGALPRVAGLMFGSQIGQALGALAKDSFGSSDTGLLLGDAKETALVLSNVDAFSDGLDIPAEEVMQYLAVREAAHARLLSSVGWLAGDLLQAVVRYAEEIAIDPEALLDATRDIDLSDPQSLQMSGINVFSLEMTPAQERALERLETMLALIEGWVETVTHAATAPYLPHADQLREMIRRRRVSGSGAEQMLAQLVGLHLRPKQARGAARIFQDVAAAEGAAARDELWRHPELVPSAAELRTPESFLTLRDATADAADELDAALDQLLDGTLGWAEGLDPSIDSAGDQRQSAGSEGRAPADGASGGGAPGNGDPEDDGSGTAATDTSGSDD